MLNYHSNILGANEVFSVFLQYPWLAVNQNTQKSEWSNQARPFLPLNKISQMIKP